MKNDPVAPVGGVVTGNTLPASSGPAQTDANFGNPSFSSYASTQAQAQDTPQAPLQPQNPVQQPEPAPKPQVPKKRWLSWGNKGLRIVVFVVTGLLLLLALVWTASTYLVREKPKEGQLASKFNDIELPLSDIVNQDSPTPIGSRSLVVNGQLRASDSFIISPSTQPSNGTPGQIYYDQTSNELNYFNGTTFVSLSAQAEIPEPTEESPDVDSIGGVTGAVTLGGGLIITGDQLSNSGVLSLQGSSGDVTLTAGSGVSITGTTIANTGVISVASGSPNISVANDGNGNITLTTVATNGVTSNGGTTGTLPVFSSAFALGDSIISQSGLVATVTGNLSVTGALTLGDALTLANGGTGATSLTANGVLIGNGTGAITAVTAGGPNQCLVSTAGAPTFTNCVNNADVSSLNGLTGALSIANASGAASTITIDNASTSAKGIAQFNATNFSDNGGGVINTIQNINSGATPTFAGVNTNSINPSGALTIGATGQQLTLQGNASTLLTATGSGFTTTVGFSGVPTAGVTYNFDRTAAAGTYSICSSVGNCAGLGGVIGGSGTLNTLAKFTPDGNNIGNSTITDNGTTVTTSVNMVIQGGSATIGTASQAGSLIVFDSTGGQTTTLQAGNSGSNLTFILPTTAGSSTQCLKQSGVGNQLVWDDCDGGTGGSSGVSSLNALTGDLSILGTTNQVVVSPGGSDITLTLPQIIHTGASPTFTGLTLSGDLAVNGGDITSTGALTITPTSGTLGVTGNLNISTGSLYQVNGVQISSGNLSNDSNLAKINASQTFTGNDNAFRTGSNSTSSFSIERSDGIALLTADTTGSQILLGVASSLAGTLVFQNASNTNTATIQSGVTSGSYTLTLPTALPGSTQCLQSTSGGALSFISCDTSTLQTAYDTDADGSDTIIALTTADDGVIIRNPSSSGSDSTYNLVLDQLSTGAKGGLSIQSAGTSNLLLITDTTATARDVLTIADGGAATFRNQTDSTTGFRVLNAAGTVRFTIDTTGGNITIGTSDTTGTLLVLDDKTGSGDPTGVSGGMYYSSDVDRFRCYEDGAWVNCGAMAGEITMYGGSSAPSGWLMCDGSAVSRTTYAALFAIVSTTYGAGDGSTTFNLPDMRARTAVGSGSSITRTYTFSSRSGNIITVTGTSDADEIQSGQAFLYDTTSGAIGGLTDNTTYYAVRVDSDSFYLTTTRSGGSWLGGFAAITLTSDGSGTQTFRYDVGSKTLGQMGGEEKHTLSSGENGTHVHVVGIDQDASFNEAGSERVWHSTGISGSETTMNTETNGNADPHNNLQPFTVVNYIIRY